MIRIFVLFVFMVASEILAQDAGYYSILHSAVMKEQSVVESELSRYCLERAQSFDTKRLELEGRLTQVSRVSREKLMAEIREASETASRWRAIHLPNGQNLLVAFYQKRAYLRSQVEKTVEFLNAQNAQPVSEALLEQYETSLRTAVYEEERFSREIFELTKKHLLDNFPGADFVSAEHLQGEKEPSPVSLGTLAGQASSALCEIAERVAASTARKTKRLMETGNLFKQD